MTRLDLFLCLSAGIFLSSPTVSSPLPSSSIAKISTDSAAGNYHHHTDLSPRIDTVYDQVTLPKSHQLKRDNAEAGRYFFPKPGMVFSRNELEDDDIRENR